MDLGQSPKSSKVSRKRPRPAYSCLECTRRKLRCSKQIPCSACVERGIEHLCRRRAESHSVGGKRSFPAKTTTLPETNHGLSDSLANTPASRISPTLLSSSQTTPVTSNSAHITTTPSPSTRQRQRPVENVTDDAAVMLEFLALNRQRVLQIAQIGQPQLSGGDSNTAPAFDLLFSLDQVRVMMLYHQESISWVHNVVHLPTFRGQCEQSFANSTQLKWSWASLYYAMLAVSLHRKS